MKAEISKRCGIGDKCEHYDRHNKISGCKIYQDRRECLKSMKHRNKVSKHSKKQQKNNVANLWR